jgi:hypothetical protein
LGINCVVVELSDAPGNYSVNASDFKFATGNSNDTTTWTPLTVTPTVFTISVQGDTTYVEIRWPDNTIVNKWLQITALADANTGLSANQSVYFGNLIGEMGNSTTLMQVTAVDLVIDQLQMSGSVGYWNQYDVNHDGRVSAADLVLIQNNSFQSINLITPTGNGPASLNAVAAAVASSSSETDLTGNSKHRVYAKRHRPLLS